MPRTSRLIVQVCVSLLAVAGLHAATSRRQQTSAPPQTPRPQTSPAQLNPVAGTPEQRAFQEATRIQDPAKKLEALRKVRADLSGSVAVFVVRQVDEAILWHLVTEFRDRRDEIDRAFGDVVDGLPASPPESRLLSVPGVVSRLLDNNVVLERAEKVLTDLLAVAAATKPVEAEATPAQTMLAQLSGRTPSTRGHALEVLARLHIAQGQPDRAAADLKEAVALSPLGRAPAMLAEIEIKRGNKAAALEQYTVAAVTGRMSSKEDAAFRALYREVRGSEGNLEAELNRLYERHFPNPIAPEPYAVPAAWNKRVVLLELFTGSACAPCVSADLSWDAVIGRYPEALIAPIAYHAHVPGPDPMVIAAGDARRLQYAVKGVPSLHINGALGRIGGGPREAAPRQYREYTDAVEKALEHAPTARVDVLATRSGSRIAVTAKASGLPADGSDLRLHLGTRRAPRDVLRRKRHPPPRDGRARHGGRRRFRRPASRRRGHRRAQLRPFAHPRRHPENTRR